MRIVYISLPVLACAAQHAATKASQLFSGESRDSRAEAMGPLLIVSLLGRVPEQAHAAATTGDREADDEVLARLQRLVNLLESYFHPSNTGQCAPCSIWCS